MAEAKNNLPRLVDRMLRGETVLITRRGKPVARVVPVEPAHAAPRKLDLDWLRRLRDQAATDAEPGVDTVRQMRDDYRY